MKLYERIYDNPINKDGTKKPNKFLGHFELLEGDMNDYSYQCIVRNKNMEVFKLVGREVSGFYYPNEGGTKHFLTPLSESPDVIAYLKYVKGIL